MAEVKVPRTPPSSFNSRRRASSLLLDQIKHLEWALLPASQRKTGWRGRRKMAKTEGQAAERIAQLMAMLFEQQENPPRVVEDGVQPHVTLPPLPRARHPRRTARRREATAKKAGVKKRASRKRAPKKRAAAKRTSATRTRKAAAKKPVAVKGAKRQSGRRRAAVRKTSRRRGRQS